MSASPPPPNGGEEFERPRRVSGLAARKGEGASPDCALWLDAPPLLDPLPQGRGDARPPPRRIRRRVSEKTRGWRGASVRDAGDRVFVCFASLRDAPRGSFTEGGSRLDRPLHPLSARVLIARAFQPQTGAWRCAGTRTDSVEPCRIPGTAFNSVPRATGSEAPRMTANTSEYSSGEKPV